VSELADREQRLRHLAEANVAVGSEVSLENVLQKTVETAAGLVAANVGLAAGQRLPTRVETALFRITQEALTNVVKHADAKIVHITFSRQERSVVLTIDDDGCGFSRAQVPSDRFGLVGMRERTASVNGALDIESRRWVPSPASVCARARARELRPTQEVGISTVSRCRRRRLKAAIGVTSISRFSM
jgi:signal transduction histidine kinase